MDNEKAKAEKPKPRKGSVGGGRAHGQKNLVAPGVKKSVTEIFRGMMGLDDETVARTGKINGKGYGFRLRWQEMLDGKRAPDPAYTNVVKLSLSYAAGMPARMKEEREQRQSLYFVTQSGHFPWAKEMDNMREQTERMLAEQEAEEKLRALEAAKPVVIDAAANDEAPETLERVNTPEPPDNPEAFR